MVSADDVLALAESWYPDRSPLDLLAVLRAEQERFVPTWLSARATREPLPDSLAAEVAAVLADVLGPAGVARARQLAGPLGLLPELRGIFELARRHGLPIPEPPVGTGAARLARARRATRFAAASRRRPLRASLRVLQHTELQGPEASRGRRRAWQIADRRLPVLSPARADLFRFGLPVDVRGATDRPLLRTPFGDYLMVTGAEVTEDWLDDGLVPTDAAAAEE